MMSVKATLVTADGRRDVTRRFLADYDAISCYVGLAGKISQVFPGLTPNNFAIYYKDSDGDLIIVSSDEEVALALTFVPSGGTLNIVIKDNGSPDLLHPGVICDGCNGAIYGRRYKCAVCYDYDLCATCDEKGNHPNHPMIRIATPVSKCFANRGPQYCGMGGSRGRFCPRFQEGATCPGLFASPYAFAFGGTDPLMNNFPKMAETIMKNWCEAMQQPQPSKKDEKADPKKPDSAEKTTPEEGTERAGECEFDPANFAAVMEEISENFCEALKTIGSKRRASEEEKQTSEEPKEKQSRSANGCCTEGAAAGFDFEKVEEMVRPIIGNFVGAMGGQSFNEKREPTDQKEGQENREKPPNFEDVLRPWVDMWQNFMSASQENRTGAPRSEEPGPQEAAHSGEGFDHEQAAKNVYEMMSGMFQQLGVNPNTSSTPQNESASSPTEAQRTSGDSNTSNGQEKKSQSVNSNGQDAQSESNKIKFNFRNPERQDSEGTKSEDSRVARSLAQLKSMGFNDDGGWLTSLLEAKGGDVGRVLDVILPSTSSRT